MNAFAASISLRDGIAVADEVQTALILANETCFACSNDTKSGAVLELLQATVLSSTTQHNNKEQWLFNYGILAIRQ